MSKEKVILKSKEDYAKYYKRVVDYSSNDGWVVKIPELPGCTTHGATPQAAFKNSFEAIVAYLEMLEEDGVPFPMPSVLASEIKNFPLRIDVGTFENLKAFAAGMNLSINEYIVRKLKEDGTIETLAHGKISPEINEKIAAHVKHEKHKKLHASPVSREEKEQPRRRTHSKKSIAAR